MNSIKIDIYRLALVVQKNNDAMNSSFNSNRMKFILPSHEYELWIVPGKDHFSRLFGWHSVNTKNVRWSGYKKECM